MTWKHGAVLLPSPPLAPTCRSTAKGPERRSAPIKQLLLTANGKQNNEGRPRSARQSDNREIMTSVAPFGL